MDLNVIIRKRGVQVGAAAAVLLAVAISLAVMSASPGGNSGTPEPLVAGGSAQEGTLTAAGNVAGSEQERASAEQDAVTAGGSGSPDAPTSPSPGTGSTADDTTENPAALTKRVRIMWWNDTESTPLTGALVSIGSSSWSPNESAASDVGALTVAVDKPSTLVVYPDGPGGARIEVPILFQKMMKDDSEQDAIIVEVSDKSVRVLGNPVDNVDQTFNRF